GELPGTCAHFVVDRDGTIYQLVRLPLACRHTVGLNWTAVGIELVGTSDAEILHNPAQLRASLALTLWLADRYRIGLGDVICHNESLTSIYHRERLRVWLSALECALAGFHHGEAVQRRRRPRRTGTLPRNGAGEVALGAEAP